MLERVWSKGTLLHCWWERKLVQPLWRTVWRFLKRLKRELPYDPAIPLLGIYPEKTIIQKDTCTPMFIAALFTITRTWIQPTCPLRDEWMKMWYIYIQWILVMKKNEIMPGAATWMDQEIIKQSEVSQKEKDKYYAITFTWELKKNATTNLFTKQKQAHRLQRQTSGYQRGKGGRGIN